MKLITAAAVATVALTALPHGTEAHGFISEPKAVYTGGSSYTSFSKEFQADSKFGAGPWNWSPQQNTDRFTAAWPKTGYGTLRALFKAKQVSECGYTNPNIAAIDVSKMKSMKYQNNEYKEGFLKSHQGPCEVWIDNTRVFQNNDCAKNYQSFPAVLPVDYSKCKGTCRLSFYWLALHSQNWQAYGESSSLTCVVCLVCVCRLTVMGGAARSLTCRSLAVFL
ncbi:hypothetical protein PybrP1_000411 [[Pythium] brassicae (nom. inval.)]|nr:hypothetical protein PybrP1_000411 [[Pythium] brassicae (nom. inval.)]